MRKLIPLFLVFLLLACSSSNDDPVQQPTNNNDQFIGKWYFGNLVYKLNDGSDYVEPISFCESQSYYRFNADGTAEILSYIETGSGCEQEAPNLQSFTWSKINDHTYRLKSTENDGTQSSRDVTVYFESNNTMYWVDVFDGITEQAEEFHERWSYFNRE